MASDSFLQRIRQYAHRLRTGSRPPASDPEGSVEWPDPPADAEATIEVKLWPAAGDYNVRRGCAMTAEHFQYVLLEGFGDRYDASVDVASEGVPPGVRDRSAFKDWLLEDGSGTADEAPAAHANVFVDARNWGGSACCGFGHVSLGTRFDDPTWNAVKRRRYGRDAYFMSAIIHEGMHCIGVSHEDSNEWLERRRRGTVEIDGEPHSPIMGTGYLDFEEDGWHLFELHPDNDQQLTLQDWIA